MVLQGVDLKQSTEAKVVNSEAKYLLDYCMEYATTNYTSKFRKRRISQVLSTETPSEVRRVVGPPSCVRKAGMGTVES